MIKLSVRHKIVKLVVAGLITCSGTLLSLQAYANTLNIHNGADASSLDPHKLSGDWENRIAGDIFEGLVTEDMLAEPIPGQATEWSLSDDGLVYTFTLREGIN